MGSVGSFSAADCAGVGSGADDDVDREGAAAGVGQDLGSKGTQASCNILDIEGDGFGILSRAYDSATGVRRGSGTCPPPDAWCATAESREVAFCIR